MAHADLDKKMKFSVGIQWYTTWRKVQKPLILNNEFGSLFLSVGMQSW